MNLKNAFVVSSVVLACLFGRTVLALPSVDNTAKDKLDLSYEIGKLNDVVGVVKNRSIEPVRIVLEFKGFAADGMVSQSGGIAIVNNLGPGESARFRGVGFTERIVRAELISARTTAP